MPSLDYRPVVDPYNITYGLDDNGKMVVSGTGTQGDLVPTFDYSPTATPINWAMVGGVTSVAALLIALVAGRRR